MWKKVAFVIGFIALLFAADRGVSLVLGELMMRSNLRVSKLYGGRVDADVVLIGNSRGVHLAATEDWSRTLCRPVYNLSLNGLDAATQDALLRDMLERNPPPKVAVIEISNLFADNSTAAELKPFLGESDRLRTLIKAQSDTIFPWLDISHLYRFNTEYLLRGLLFLVRSSDQQPEPMATITPAIIETFLDRDQHFDVNERSVRILASTLEVLKARGVEPFLVLAPYHPATFRNRDWLPDALARVKAGLPADVAINDWSRALVADADADFSDPLHMSSAGRRVLAGRIAMSPLGRAASLCPTAFGQKVPGHGG